MTTSRTTDRQIAEAMGWTVGYDNDRECYSLYGPDGLSVISHWPDAFQSTDEAQAKLWEIGVPHYSTDIRDAWQLIDHLKELGYWSEVVTYWDKSVVRTAKLGIVDRERDKVVIRTGDTAPAAICAAFLAALPDAAGEGV
jgi:hypothetical protein